MPQQATRYRLTNQRQIDANIDINNYTVAKYNVNDDISDDTSMPIE